MTDLSEKVKHALEVAQRLRVATEKLNGQLARAEEGIRKLGLGVSAGVNLATIGDDVFLRWDKSLVRSIESWNAGSSVSKTVWVTDDAMSFLLGTADGAWPISVSVATAWFAYMLGLREARAMKKRKRPPPRGRGYRADIAARSEELARAALAELLLQGLVFVTEPAEHNKYLREGDRPLDTSGETTYYSLTSVAESQRGKNPGRGSP